MSEAKKCPKCGREMKKGELGLMSRIRCMTKILNLPSEVNSYSLAHFGVLPKKLKLTDAVIAD
jgi:hypothetical protein